MIIDALPRWVTRAVQLVAFTLVPLVGVLVFGWDWRSILVLYWLENISVGAVNVVRMLRTRPTAEDGSFTLNGREVPISGPGAVAAKLFLSAFFCLHYGLFTLVHGVFVFVIVGGGFGVGTSATEGSPGLAGIDWGPALLVWGVGTAIQLAIALFGSPPTEQLGRMFIAPYRRIVALHLTIIGGVFLIAFLGWAPIAAVLLIVLHAVIDVAHWWTQDRRSSAQADPRLASPS